VDGSRRGRSRRLRAAPDHWSLPVCSAASVQPAREGLDNADAVLSLQEKIKFVDWHIKRHDQLRASAAGRASIVLSACAILSAGNAIILSQLLSSSSKVKGPSLVVLSAGIAANVLLIVLTVIWSTSVLISVRPSRKMFPEENRPPSLLFHASDTVRYIKSFPQFQAVIESEDYAQVLEQAEVELWLAVHHYIYRYGKLRKAVLAFRGAAIIFLCALIASVIINLGPRF
jgi:hypothetical protein